MNRFHRIEIPSHSISCSCIGLPRKYCLKCNLLEKYHVGVKASMALKLFFVLISASGVSTSLATGIIALKEQSFHADASANILIFQEEIDDGRAPFVKFVTGSGQVLIDRIKIVAKVDVPDAIPDNITDDSHIEPLRKSLDELSEFSKRYQKSSKSLATYIASLSKHISLFDSGSRRVYGKWLTSQEYTSMQEDAKKEQQLRMDNYIALKAQENKALADAEAFATNQRNKGFVEYNGAWITREEFDKIQKSNLEIATARDLVNSKSIRNSLYSILQVTEDGVIATIHEGTMKQGGINTSAVFVLDIAKGSVSEGDKYGGTLFWAGTYSYINLSGYRRTINAYSITVETALQRAISNLRDGPEKQSDIAVNKPPDANSPKIPPVLVGAKSSGSGFFVGESGYFVTNAHVVEGAQTIEIYRQDKIHKTTVVKIDAERDLALLKIEDPIQGLRLLAKDSEPGDEIYTIGFPRPGIQGLGVKVTKGIISSKNGMHDNNAHYQLDASIQPGNSGGPVCDSQGRLVGVVVSMLDQLAIVEATGTIPQNVNYAIKASGVISFLKSNGISPESSDFTNKKQGETTSIKIATEATAMVIAK